MEENVKGCHAQNSQKLNIPTPGNTGSFRENDWLIHHELTEGIQRSVVQSTVKKYYPIGDQEILKEVHIQLRY